MMPIVRQQNFARSGHWSFDSRSGVELHGFYAQETYEGRSFRWSAHCASVYLPLQEGQYRLRLEWDPACLLSRKDLLRVEFNGRRISKKDMVFDRTSLEFVVSNAMSGWGRLSWAVTPFPAPADGRLLGLPVCQLDWNECTESANIPASSQPIHIH